MKTCNTKPSQVESQWHVFDARDQILGRLATEVSGLLQGKHKPIYARHILTGDYVIVVNASKIRVTGRKLEQELYRSHSNYPGSLRETPMFEVLENHPDRIIRAAVRGMLPKNILGRQMLKRLKIYAGETHPHEAQIRGQANVKLQERPTEQEGPTQAEAQSVAESNGESTEDKAVS
ncbi:MAG: 50S ribosomal protein L13 [Chloroflexi bacterium]|nr:50S ribosomal protein L13 [Chloroflexota bacterium]